MIRNIEKQEGLEERMLEYIRTSVREELLRKGKCRKEAEGICEIFIGKPESRERIIDDNGLESIRVCEHCGKPMHEGYLKDDYETYCCEECVKAACGMTDGLFEEMLSHADENDAPLFWTAWEG